MSFIRSALAAVAFIALSQGAVQTASAANAENTVVLKLKDGDVAIQLRPDLAPKHVAQIEKLVGEGAYNGVAFHRVIPGFMAQTGDVKFGNVDKGFDASRVGTGGSDYPDIPAEFSKNPSCAARSAWPAAKTRIQPIRNSSSCLRTAHSSTASTPWSARLSAAWISSTR